MTWPIRNPITFWSPFRTRLGLLRVGGDDFVHYFGQLVSARGGEAFLLDDGGGRFTLVNTRRGRLSRWSGR